MSLLAGQRGRDLKVVLDTGETLTREFKSDKKTLADRDLVAAVVAMANTEGGYLFLGVEDDGAISGVQPVHQDTAGLEALIAAKTNPSLSVRAELREVHGLMFISILVPKAMAAVATSDGRLLRRRLSATGKPEAVPFFPHEVVQRQSAMRLTDPSAFPLLSLTNGDLNSVERQRLREAIRRYGGDRALLPLSDDELDDALGLVTSVDGVRRPTVAGLLMMGREETLRRHLPAHEVALQVLDGTEVRVNEFFRKPLLQTFEEISVLFAARIHEREIEQGLFRVPIPNYDRTAFREGFINALVHRDYARLGAVHVRMDDEGLTISNPGGFVEGVTLSNLLVVAPRSRNPLLADILKRIGLAERTGRGIDRIYEGMLRYGRPAPDYALSDDTSVVLVLSKSDADVEFIEMILEHEQRTKTPMPVDSLIVLSRLRHERRLRTSELVTSTQKSEQATRGILERLVEADLVEAHGTGRGRTYTLSTKVYRHAGQEAAYIRQAAYAPIQQEEMVLKYVDKHGSIRRAQVADLCKLSPTQAYYLLCRLMEQGKLSQHGTKKQIFLYTNAIRLYTCV